MSLKDNFLHNIKSRLYWTSLYTTWTITSGLVKLAYHLGWEWIGILL